ncbi:hypothetical protein BDZ45DRAFT_682515 [Acephala macrosclerotiorum]|nr:hypothetical protein BDZ45DRAFT_682515 [Acephala macrosclerotiorum]
MHKQPYRHACDRCHSLKLRCLRGAIDGNTCVRCSKAGATCVFSLSNRGRRPRPSEHYVSGVVSPSQRAVASNAADDLSLVQNTHSSGGGLTMPNKQHSVIEMDVDNSACESGTFSAFILDWVSASEQNASIATTAAAPDSGDATLELDLDPFLHQPDLLQQCQQQQNGYNLSLNSDSIPTLTGSRESAPFIDLASDHCAPSLYSLHKQTLTDANANNPNCNLDPCMFPSSPSFGPLQRRQLEPPALYESNSAPSRLLSPAPIDHDNAQTRFLVRFIRDISEIDIKLVQHTSAVSSPNSVMMVGVGSVAGGSGKEDSLKDQECAIDTTLDLTQRLIGILSELYRWMTQDTNPRDTNNPSSQSDFRPQSLSSLFHHMSSASTSESRGRMSPEQRCTTPPEPGTAVLDEVSFLHILSSYSRLINAYDVIFKQTLKCYGPSLANGSRIPLPRLRIGSFYLENSTAHIPLVIQSALQLLDRTREIVDGISSHVMAEELTAQGENDTTPAQRALSNNLIKTTVDTIRQREGEMMKKAVQLQQASRKDH